MSRALDQVVTTSIMGRLRKPYYWLSGSPEGHEGLNNAPREAADVLEETLTALHSFMAGALEPDPEDLSPPARMLAVAFHQARAAIARAEGRCPKCGGLHTERHKGACAGPPLPSGPPTHGMQG